MGRTKKDNQVARSDAEDMKSVYNRIRGGKSRELYEKSWKDFTEYNRIRSRKPTEQDFVAWFENLKKSGYAPNTIWTVYSRLNTIYSDKFGEKLQIAHPKLSTLLKNYKKGSTKKSPTFTKEEILEFINRDEEELPGESAYLLVRKALHEGL